MDSFRLSWEADYQRRGFLWGGSPPLLQGIQPAARILELGCGDCRTAASLVRAGHHVVAVDFAKSAVRLCRKRLTGPGAGDVLVGNCQTLPFRDRSFDTIIAFHVAGHLPDYGRPDFAGEIHRILIAGGSVYFREFSREDFRYGTGLQTGPGTFLRNNGISTHYFEPAEITDLFPGLALRSLHQHRWEMQVRGVVYPRSEISAVFGKPA